MRCADTPDQHSGIDPFSTEYWKTAKPTKGAGSVAPTASKKEAAENSAAGTLAMAPPPAPSDAFAVLGSSSAQRTKNQTPPPDDVVDMVRQTLAQYPKLSRVGLIELVASETKRPRIHVKDWVDALVDRVSTTGKKKILVLKE